MSKLEEYSGCQYAGGYADGRMDGRGRYTLPNGHVYEGEFHDGMFHGRGRVLFPNGGMLEAQWDQGRPVAGTEEYTFDDGLKYNEKEWKYLVPEDRRFHSERVGGSIHPAGDLQLSNARPPRPGHGKADKGAVTTTTSAVRPGDRGPPTRPMGGPPEDEEAFWTPVPRATVRAVDDDVPAGCYWVGTGLYMDPNCDTVYDCATGQALRQVDDDEREWIVHNCRQSTAAAAQASATMATKPTSGFLDASGGAGAARLQEAIAAEAGGSA